MTFREFVNGNQSLDQNRGSWKTWLDRYEQLCQRATELGSRAVAELVPHLFCRATDTRNLIVAWNQTRLNDHAGRDGERCEHFEGFEWEYVRWLSEELRQGLYTPGPTVVVPIPKGPGRGTRPIQLHNLCDRLVQRGLVQILQPVLDPRFDVASVGYRPELGRLHGLAQAEQFFLAGHAFWIAADIAQAFEKVPQRRLLSVLQKSLRWAKGSPFQTPARQREVRKLFDLMERVLVTSEGDGIPQGGPISPLMLNTYLNHVFDRLWRQKYPALPFVRSADDILVCCESGDEAEAGLRALTTMTTAIGMPLKPWPRGIRSIHDLTIGDSVVWLGFDIRAGENGLDLRIAQKSRDSLEAKLADPDTTNIEELILSWLSEMGPAYACEDRRKLYRWIAQMADEHDLSGVPRPNRLERVWHRASVRWQEVRDSYRQIEDLTSV